MRVLLIEDDEAIIRALRRGLATRGHQLVGVETGPEGVALVRTGPVDLVLLDIALPGLDGHETLARLRAIRPDLPILMLTARDDLQNKVRALEGGADDYLTKPFALEELLARVHALTRRAEQRTATLLEVGPLRLDLRSRKVWRDDASVYLSSREFSLLEYLMRHPGQLLSRQQILAAVWEYGFDPESNIVDVYVRHLRRKIDLPDEPSLITTLRGSGYRLDPSGADG